MASTQASNVGQLNAQEKAKIVEALKEAKSLHAKQPNAKAIEQDLAMVVGGMQNDQERPIGLLRKHAYKGKFIANPIDTIPAQGLGGFMNLGAPTDGQLQVVVGPKAAVIYGHNDHASIHPYCGWLLAYYKPADVNALGKVYVEAGHIEKLKKMEWAEIEKKLDASGDVSKHWDSETGAMASAMIQPDEKDNTLAFVGANFEVKN